MKKRFFLFAALLASVAILVTSIVVTAFAHRSYTRAMQNQTAAEAVYLCQGIELYGEDYLNRLNLERGHRVTLISPDGTVTFDSKSNAADMENHAGRPEVQEALASGTGSDTRLSDTLREQTYYHAIRMDDNSVFRLASSMDSLLASYDELFWLVVGIVLCGVLLAALISSLVTKKIVQPLNHIDLDAPDQANAYEEIAPLLTHIKHQSTQLAMQGRELDHQRAHLNAIMENMNEGLLVLEPDGTVLSHNKSALRLLGVPMSQPIGTHILTLNRSIEFREAIQAATEGHPLSLIMEIGGRQCQLFVSPVSDEDTPLGFIVILMDVTEQQEREKLRREFTANVSHELKTPLTAISGYAEIIMNGVAHAEDIPEFAQSIYQESGRLIALIRDLMFLSRLEEGSAPPRETVQLDRLAEDAVLSLSSKAAAGNIRVTLDTEEASLTGIPSILQEMLYNLLDNAIKYNRSGGSVSLRLRKAPTGSILLSVSDTGIGIPKTEQARIFERFYRVDKSHNKLIEGTGLGLAIVKHGALLHEAELTLSSSEAGSTFTLLFPASCSC